MYLSYYNLSKKPFQISTDPNFLWLGETHQEALSMLKYGVMDDKGFLLLTGDVGTGKTTLINAFVNSLGDDVIVSRVSDPGLTQTDLINYIARMFEIETKFETKSEFVILFTQFLEQAHKDDKKVLLIIDEAQHLTDETLEEIRLLSNIENQDKKLLNIFLVGQSEFNETLEKHKNRAFRQRLTLNFTLYPLKAEETKACIEFRLKIAGSEKEIFTPDAIDAIHTISNGFPRVINIICDHALRLGCQEDQPVISAAIIHQCSKSIYALQTHHSHQYDNGIGSTTEWLEESEVPPLSPEEISRISQPLPDFIVDTEDDTKDTTRSHSRAVPLLLVVLFISGFFLLKDTNMTSFSNFVTSLKKSAIAAIEKIDSSISQFKEINQQDGSPTPSASVTVAEDSLKVDQPEIDQLAADEELNLNISSEVAQVIDKSVPDQTAIAQISSEELVVVDVEMSKQDSDVLEVTTTPALVTVTKPLEKEQQESNTERAQPSQPVQPQLSISQNSTDNATKSADVARTRQFPSEASSVDTVIEPSVALAKSTTETIKEIKEDVPVISEPVTTEQTNMTEVQSHFIEEDENIESEVIEEPPITLTETTTSIVKQTVDSENQSLSPITKQAAPEDIEPPVVLTEGKSEPQTPPPSSKEQSNTNEDPGAVIDWLLKAKKN